MTGQVEIRGNGLEIGPLCWPILKKSDAKIQYVDHASTETLRKLYHGDPGVPPEQIVDVDFPLNGRSLLKTVGKKRFSYILASHVIEHVPDMVGWLNDMASVLKPGGVLSLAVPDKRFTFDIDRDVSRPADVVGAHVDGLRKPSTLMIFDYISNYRAKVDPNQAWAGQLYLSEKAGPHRYSLQDAWKYSLINRDTDEYVDTHCFVYTPASFFEVLGVLFELSLIPFEVAGFHDTAEGEYEFFVSLRKVSKPRAGNAAKKTLPRLERELTNRELRAELQLAREELTQAQATNQALLQSSSWKITKPLRFAGRTVRKVIRR
jgi:predicted SAM-dependent methyltransferase